MATIIIADDQPHLRDLFFEKKQDEGYRIIRTGDSELAKGCVMDLKPDLVLLELSLNGFEGWDLLHDLKSSDPDLPVLIVTAYDNFRNDPRVSEADGYIVKNFMAIERLKEKVEDLLNQKPSAGSMVPSYE